MGFTIRATTWWNHLQCTYLIGISFRFDRLISSWSACMIFLHLKCINLISQERRSCPLSAKKVCEFLVFFSKSREINPKWGNFTKVSVLSSRWAPLTTLFVCQYRSWKCFICETLMYQPSIKAVEDTIKESLMITTNLVIL